MAGRSYCRCTPPDCDCDERADAAITAYLAATLPADVAALVERLRSQANALDDAVAMRTYLVDHARGLVLRSFEAATLIEALASRSPNETLERAAKVADDYARASDAEVKESEDWGDGYGMNLHIQNSATASGIAAAIRSMKEPE